MDPLFRKHEKSQKWLVRIITAYLLQLIFKYFDMSFPQQFGTFEYRGIVFTLIYMAFILLVWELANIIYKYIDRKLSYELSFNRKFIVLSIIFILYGLFVSFGFSFCYRFVDIYLFGSYDIWDDISYFDQMLNISIYFIYSMVLSFNGVVLYFNHWRDAEVKTESLKKDHIQAKYDALVNQIDPHFFFNSLSVLTSLVYKDAELSAEYITQLSKLYRYILDSKNESLVSLEKEIECLNSYIFLIKIRHGDQIHFENLWDTQTIKKYGIPSNTLQLLAENAVKHNVFSEDAPLHVKLTEDKEHLIVSNNLNQRQLLEKTSGIGLENIRHRYEILCGKQIKVEMTRSEFIVKLPKLLIEHNESPHI